MSVVEDLGVAEAVHGGPVEGLLALEPCEQHLEQRPRVVEVGAGVRAGHGPQVGQGEGAQHALRVDSWAASVRERREERGQRAKDIVGTVAGPTS